jgi:hypothetical protein
MTFSYFHIETFAVTLVIADGELCFNSKQVSLSAAAVKISSIVS